MRTRLLTLWMLVVAGVYVALQFETFDEFLDAVKKPSKFVDAVKNPFD